jgi:tetratricopeptide (TPR) repeat protein
MKKQLLLTSLSAIAAFSQDAWSERMSLANRLEEQGRYGEARQLYQSAVADAEKSGLKDLRHAQALNNLAAHYFDSGKYAEAEPMYRRALE